MNDLGTNGSDTAGSDDTTTTTYPVLPLTAGVVGPGTVLTIALETDEARVAADEAADGGQLILLPKVDDRFARIGALAHIEDAGQLPGGRRAIIVRATERVRLGAAEPGHAALWVAAEPVVEEEPTDEVERLADELRGIVTRFLERNGAERLAGGLAELDDPGALADTAIYWPDLTLEQRVQVLEETDVEARLRLVLEWAREREVIADVNRNVAEDFEKRQREAVLRRQMEQIRSELDEGGDGDQVAAYRARLAETELPETVHAAVAKELDKLERTSEQSPEHGWIVTWLDTMFELPWGQRADEHFDLGAVRAVLDADHAGLDDVKDRLVETLAVRKLRSERGLGNEGGRGSGAILALVGPPGVGKTSLGESVARALGRPFARVALGGVRDEAEIRGHRRTYVGARPGRFVRALTEAGAMNPVLLLDEIDKTGSDWRGDPSSALLEVLDPAQNHTFRDHYLEVDLDLSDVLFIATANVLDTIPGPLLDRMEVVSLDGYTEDEKVAIARDHLLPRVRERSGLTSDDVSFTDAALRELVAGYTREAGVRDLERQIGRVLRKVATKVATGDAELPVDVDVDDVRPFIGRRRFSDEVRERTSVPGVATGLAVTGLGGDVLFVEATTMPGEAGLTLTGQLGDVMKESAEIARSFVRSHADELGLDGTDLGQKRVHVHFPAGAVPKDGPSAGVTLTTALVSLLTGRLVRSDVAMTGEVSLQGQVLPIGGVKQKVLAAHRNGITTVIVPARNEADLDDVPEAVRAEMTFHLASDVRQVLDWALEPAEASAPAVDHAA
jgi:ATP-dependent Lon protease